MIWADRVGVVLGLAVVVLIAWASSGNPAGPNWARAIGVFIVFPWLLLRGLDWIATGVFWRIARRYL